MSGPHVVPLFNAGARGDPSAQGAKRSVEVDISEPVRHAEADQPEYRPVRPIPHGLSLADDGHGFRDLASTILNENGFEADWIERQLVHGERNDVRAAYNHIRYLIERKKMMQWWGDYLGRSTALRAAG